MADYPPDPPSLRSGCARQVVGMFTLGAVVLAGICMLVENYVLAGVRLERAAAVSMEAAPPPVKEKPTISWKARFEKLVGVIFGEEPPRRMAPPAEEPGTLSSSTKLPGIAEPPPLHPARELTQADLLVFLTGHHDKASDRIPDGYVADFADPVDFLGEGTISRARLLETEIARHEEWVRISETMTRMATASKVSTGWMAIYGLTIREENALSQWIEKDVDVEMVIELSDNGPKIASLRYHLRSRRGSGEIPGSPSSNGFGISRLR